jgi:heat shock protein HtpX
MGFYALALAVLVALLAAAGAGWSGSRDPYVVIVLALAGVVAWSLWPAREDRRGPGIRLSRDDQSRLFAVLDEVAQASGQAAPREVFLTLEANAWVAERGGVLGLGSRRQMGLGLPLLQGLGVVQLRAVLAHEFGHFRGGDARLGPFLYQARAAMVRLVQRLGHSALALPFAWYARLFVRVTHALSRRQERIADALAAEVAGSASFAAALHRSTALGHAFDAFWRWEFLPVVQAQLWPPLIEGFARYLQAAPIAAGLETVVEEELRGAKADPTDTHPPLRERLLEITGHLGSRWAPAEGEAMALSLLDDHRGLEDELAQWAGAGTRHSGLPRVGWAALADRLHVPSWEAHQARFGPALAGLTTDNLAAAAAAPEALLARLKKQAGPAWNPSQRTTLAATTLGVALLLALRARGWTLDVELGHPIALRHDGRELQPFELARGLLEGRGEDWEEARARHAIPVLPLDELPGFPAAPQKGFR